MNRGVLRGMGAPRLRGIDPAQRMPQYPMPMSDTGVSRWRTFPTPQTGSLTATATVLFAHPFFIPQGAQIYGIGVVCSVGAATSTVRCGIYAEDGDDRPGTLLLDTQVLLDTSTTGFKSTAASVDAEGWVWLAAAAATASPGLAQSTTSGGTDILGWLTPTNASNIGGYQQTLGSAAFPNPWGPTITETQRVPVIWVDVR